MFGKREEVYSHLRKRFNSKYITHRKTIPLNEIPHICRISAVPLFPALNVKYNIKDVMLVDVNFEN